MDNAILFCGYWRDTETGLYHIRRRMYHPLLGRWLQRDPLGYVGGMNLSEYCVSAPSHRTDPSGELVIYAEGALQDPWVAPKLDRPMGPAAKSASDALARFAENIPHMQNPPPITGVRDGYLRIPHFPQPCVNFSGAWNDLSQVAYNAQLMADAIIRGTMPHEDIFVFAHSTGAAAVVQMLEALEMHNLELDIEISGLREMQLTAKKPEWAVLEAEIAELERQKRFVTVLVIYGGTAARTDSLRGTLLATVLQTVNIRGENDPAQFLAKLGGCADGRGWLLGRQPLADPLGKAGGKPALAAPARIIEIVWPKGTHTTVYGNLGSGLGTGIQDIVIPYFGAWRRDRR